MKINRTQKELTVMLNVSVSPPTVNGNLVENNNKVKMSSTNTPNLNIILEFSAGAELLFGNIKHRKLSLDGAEKWTIAKLLKWMHANILTERPELFIQGDTVRPGILVLINDTDWELLGELDYELQQNDNVLFISTLHGG